MLVLAFLLAVGSKHLIYFDTFDRFSENVSIWSKNWSEVREAKTKHVNIQRSRANIWGEGVIRFPIKFYIWWLDWLRDWTIKAGDVKGWAHWAGQPWSWFPSGDDLGVWSEPARFREFIARSPFFGHESQVSCRFRSFRAHNFFRSSFFLFFQRQKECD